MRRCQKAVSVVLAICAISTLTACGASDRVPAGDLADQVAAAIEERVGVRTEVDCGDEPVRAVEGTTVQCEVTDLGIGATYPASVEIVNTDGQGGYDLDLSVDPTEQTNKNNEGNDS